MGGEICEVRNDGFLTLHFILERGKRLMMTF